MRRLICQCLPTLSLGLSLQLSAHPYSAIELRTDLTVGTIRHEASIEAPTVLGNAPRVFSSRNPIDYFFGRKLELSLVGEQNLRRFASALSVHPSPQRIPFLFEHPNLKGWRALGLTTGRHQIVLLEKQFLPFLQLSYSVLNDRKVGDRYHFSNQQRIADVNINQISPLPDLYRGIPIGVHIRDSQYVLPAYLVALDVQEKAYLLFAEDFHPTEAGIHPIYKFSLDTIVYPESLQVFDRKVQDQPPKPHWVEVFKSLIVGHVTINEWENVRALLQQTHHTLLKRREDPEETLCGYVLADAEMREWNAILKLGQY